MDGCAGFLFFWGGGALVASIGFFVANLFDIPFCKGAGIFFAVVCVITWAVQSIRDVREPKSDRNYYD